ncbi:hypothetical protein TREES_T100009987 [Tupaia chinensis]|uniref:Uncharacterized protein n=1 Tax=Tupaia chinensis TaxID=246437 RepID=L9KJK9_TUPCH|nr:hypothetical protein TREES_T100009987 [Tupaia chinensis]
MIIYQSLGFTTDGGRTIPSSRIVTVRQIRAAALAREMDVLASCLCPPLSAGPQCPCLPGTRRERPGLANVAVQQMSGVFSNYGWPQAMRGHRLLPPPLHQVDILKEPSLGALLPAGHTHWQGCTEESASVSLGRSCSPSADAEAKTTPSDGAAGPGLGLGEPMQWGQIFHVLDAEIRFTPAQCL